MKETEQRLEGMTAKEKLQVAAALDLEAIKIRALVASELKSREAYEEAAGLSSPRWGSVEKLRRN